MCITSSKLLSHHVYSRFAADKKQYSLPELQSRFRLYFTWFLAYIADNNSFSLHLAYALIGDDQVLFFYQASIRMIHAKVIYRESPLKT